MAHSGEAQTPRLRHERLHPQGRARCGIAHQPGKAQARRGGNRNCQIARRLWGLHATAPGPGITFDQHIKGSIHARHARRQGAHHVKIVRHHSHMRHLPQGAKAGDFGGGQQVETQQDVGAASGGKNLGFGHLLRGDADGTLFQLQRGQKGDFVGFDMGAKADAKGIKQALGPFNIRLDHVKVNQDGGGFNLLDQGHVRTS